MTISLHHQSHLSIIEALNPTQGNWPYEMRAVFNTAYLDAVDAAVDAELSSHAETYSYITALRHKKVTEQQMTYALKKVRASLIRNGHSLLAFGFPLQCLTYSFLKTYTEQVNG